MNGGKLLDIVRSEFGGWHPRLKLAQALVALLPPEAGLAIHSLRRS